jgi:hypothetical protein
MSVLARLFGSSAARAEAARAAALADPVIDRLVEATDHRLAYVKGYRETLRAPVLAARERLRALIALIPGPTLVSERSWGQDPTVRALFAHAGDTSAAFSADPGVEAFFRAHPASDCFCLLGLLQSERRVLAAALYGESVQAEVARTTVSFGEPQVLAPAAGEAAVREELVLRALEYLALRALEGVGAQRARRRELEKDRALLQAQLQLAERRGRGLGGMAGAAGAPGNARERAEIERELERTVSVLEQSASRNLVGALLEDLLAVLARPEDHLGVEPCTLCLDPMNFAVPPGPQAITPKVAILRLARRGPFAVLLARFPRAEHRAPENRLAEAGKFL